MQPLAAVEGFTVPLVDIDAEFETENAPGYGPECSYDSFVGGVQAGKYC